MASHHFGSWIAYSYVVGLRIREMVLTKILWEEDNESLEIKFVKGRWVPSCEEYDMPQVVAEDDVLAWPQWKSQRSTNGCLRQSLGWRIRIVWEEFEGDEETRGHGKDGGEELDCRSGNEEGDESLLMKEWKLVNIKVRENLYQNCNEVWKIMENSVCVSELGLEKGNTFSSKIISRLEKNWWVVRSWTQ